VWYDQVVAMNACIVADCKCDAMDGAEAGNVACGWTGEQPC